METRGVSRVATIIIACLLVSLAALGFYSVTNLNGKIATTESTISETIVSTGQNGSTSLVTITEIIIARTAIIGGSLDCSGNLSSGTCTGHSLDQIISQVSTTILSDSLRPSVFSTVTIISEGSYICGNSTTTTSTITYNATSGYGQEFVSWSRSCS